MIKIRGEPPLKIVISRQMAAVMTIALENLVSLDVLQARTQQQRCQRGSGRE